MDTDRKTLFLSGTRRDLKPFFLAAKRAFEEELPGYQVVTMESLTSEDITSERWSHREAATRDLFVGLIGRYFGTIRGEGPSLTEQEYDAAGRAGVHRLMFLTNAGEPDVIASQDDSARRRLEEFRARIQTIVCKEISTPEEFATSAVQAVREWERRTLHGLLMSAKEFANSPEFSSPDSLMSHAHAYIDPGAPGRAVEEFLASQQRILVLHGAWGRGKSRVLFESSRRELPMELRFLKRDEELSHQRLKGVSGERYALVVDDVHQRSNDQLSALLLFLQNRAPEVKLIVTTRTNRRQEFEERLRGQRFASRVIRRFEVPLLSDKEQRQLIQAILGRKDEELAYRLAKRTRGNALATVLAARSIRNGAKVLGEIEGEDFEDSIIEGFFGLLLQQAGNSEDRHQHLKQLMKLLAVVGPFRPGNAEQMDALTGFLKTHPDRLSNDLDALEVAGLISRHGGLVRVPVDAVAEHLVVDAAVNSRGESTRYIERVMNELARPFLGNILRNLAAADWDVASPKSVASVTRGVWHVLPTLFERLPYVQQEGMLEAVADIAPRYPPAALSFAEWVVESGPHLMAREGPYLDLMRSIVRRHVTRLLRSVLNEPLCVSRACDLLWKWAEPESPDSNGWPENAEHILSEAGKYRWTRSIPSYEAFVTWAASRGDGERRIPTPRLAKYLRPLLHHEVEHSWSDGETFTLSEMGLPYAPFSALRKRVIDLLIHLASEGGIEDTHRALVALGDALSEPRGAFGRKVTDEERSAWAPEQQYVLERLRTFRGKRRNRVVDLCIVEEIEWLAKHASVSSIRALAWDFLNELQEALTGTLELALVARWKLGETQEVGARRIEGLVRAAAQQLIEPLVPPQEALEELRRVSLELVQAGKNPRVVNLFEAVARTSPEHGGIWSRVLLSQPGHLLRPYAHVLARGLLRPSPEEGKALFVSILDDGSADLLRNLSLWRLGGDVFDEKTLAVHLNRLMRHPDARVREEAFHQIRGLDELPAGERARLLLDYPLAEFPGSTKDWAAAVDNGFYALYGHAELERLAVQLRSPPKLEYWGLKLLERLAGDVPAAAADTLLARVQDPAVDALEPGSHEFPVLARLPAAERQRALYTLGELFEHENPHTRFHARRFFSLLHRSDPASASVVRSRWLESGTPSDVERALGSFDAAEPEELFDHEADVTALLRAAVSLGQESLENAMAILTGVAIHGERQGSPGEPFPRDVAIRDRARGLAEKYAQGTVEGNFYREVAKSMDNAIQRRMERDAEEHV
ncbi:DUF4062 domain-containing protein [Corallococcus exiguus]|uniref:DUF4062 domain-containing protein n=1 Tax=Corallococcus exiguus TaxID=83462 RepID=UPI003DA59A1C